MTLPSRPEPLRFGILCEGAWLERWQRSCVQQLLNEPQVHAEAVIMLLASATCSHGSAARRKSPYLFRRFLERRGACHAQVPLDGGLASLPVIHATASPTSAGGVQIDPAALSMISSQRLDFILSFVDFRVARGLLESARHGVWQYHVGDWLRYRGEAPGFWEVYDDESVSAAILMRLQHDPDSIVVLREGYLRTKRSSSGNVGQLLTRFTHWPAQICRDIRNGVTEYLTGEPRRAEAPDRIQPSNVQVLAYGWRTSWRVLTAGLRLLFRHGQWNVGIVHQPIATFLDEQRRTPVQWLPARPRSEFIADPFGVMHDGRLTVMCELLDFRDGRGIVIAIDLASGVTRPVSIGPQPAVHLSYPFLSELDGRVMCLPEAHQAGEIALYEAERFPDRWVKLATLVANPDTVDATLFRYGHYWWLAGSQPAGKGANAELHLWYAPELTGPWSAHPGNPVKTDVRSARPAGTPFVHDGVLYRPAQDSSRTYGGRVIINRVLTLTPTAFREEPAATVSPDPAGPYADGLHTISAVGDLTLIDGKRWVFAPVEFRRILGDFFRTALRKNFQ